MISLQNIVCYQGRPRCEPLKNEIDFSSPIIRFIHVEYHRIHKKKHTIILYFCIFEIHPRNIIAESCKSVECLSAAWPSGSEGRFYNGHVRKVDGSTPTQASLLRPWTRCFTTIISAWRNLASSKLKKPEAKLHRNTRKQRQLQSESGFVQRIAPPSLSRDRRTQIKKKSHPRKSNV